MDISPVLEENLSSLQQILPLAKSFDFMTRRLKLGDTDAFFLGVNGFCKTEILQQIFSDLQNPLYMKDNRVEDIGRYVNAKIGYAQTSLTNSLDTLVNGVLSGPAALLIDGFAQAVLIDVRTYPGRSMSEPDLEKVTKGSREGLWRHCYSTPI